MKGFDHKSGKHLDIDSSKIYYEVTGVDNNPPLLILHGGFGNIENFNDIIPELLNNFKVIGIDCRGQGKSTLGKNELTYELLQKDVEKVLSYLKIDQLNILGFSDGGVIAYRLASFSKLKVNKLITIGSRWHVKNIRPMKEVFSKITGEILRERYPSNYDVYQRYNPEPDIYKLGKELVKLWLDESKSGYPNENIRNISCSTLLMRGESDPIISDKDLIEASEMIKRSKMITIPNASHVIFKDQKEQFLLSMKQFLKE